jgi:predicted cupin superfamily sugar epimerase
MFEVAGVEETAVAGETVEGKLHCGGVGELEAIAARGAEKAIEVGDAVEAGEDGRSVVSLGVIGTAVKATNSNIVMVTAAVIFDVIQSLGLP